MKLGRGADAIGVGAAKLVVSLAVLAAGFRAVSDDDYARVVIAERFAQAPALDPSGTSWLPLPFWVYGIAFRLFGSTLVTARIVAVLLGVGAMVLLFSAARLFGAGRTGALTGALLAALLPWSAWLGAATVPEVPAAALAVFSLATLGRAGTRERALGAVAIAAACFCRYEAWPIAGVFAGLTLCDAVRSRARHLFAVAALALLPIALWLLHGVFVHGDAFFFWKRVASYKHALGEGSPWFERLFNVPLALITEEPALWLGLVVVAGDLRGLTSYRRARLAALALLVFLVIGEVSGGAPTHHAGRAVLPVWYLLALELGDAVGRRADARPGRLVGWLAFASSLVALAWVYRLSAPPGFPDRGAAVEIGTRARELGAPGLFIDGDDYSYLAVTAAYGSPGAAEPFDDHDPRHPRPADPFASEAALRARLAGRPAAWLVARREHAELADSLGQRHAESERFILVAPRPSASP